MDKKLKITEDTLPNTPIRFFLHISRKYIFWAILASFIVTIAATASVMMRYLVEKIIDAIDKGDVQIVLFMTLLYPVSYLIINGLSRLSGVTGRVWLLGAPKATTNVLSKYLSKHSHTYFSNRFAGSISNKISNVSNAMEQFVGLFIWNYLENTVPIIIIGIIFFQTDFWIGILFSIMIVLTIMMNILLMPRKRKYSLDLASSQSKTSGFLVDIFSNVQAVRQYSRFNDEQVLVEDHTNEVEKKAGRTFLYSEYMMFVNTLLFTVFSLAMFLILTDKWQAGEVSSGRLVSFILLTTYISGTFIFLGLTISSSAQIYGRAQEGLDDILLPHEINDQKDAIALKINQGEIVWDKVGFKYEDNDIFKNFNLKIAPGSRVGLVGSSGAGKSTFVSLLLRQHDLLKGHIIIDGQDISEVTQNSLREAIAIVPQEPTLFHRSIRENIAYGKPDATDEEIIAVAKKAQAHTFITKLSKGYDTTVGERGIKLSGGQKQRIAIARAMLKDSPILVLDEATSALDSESEVAIQKALHFLMSGKTVIAIAHRLSTLREMDRILVLKNGRITEDGSHEELKENGGTYQTLWEHQAGGFVGE